MKFSDTMPGVEFEECEPTTTVEVNSADGIFVHMERFPQRPYCVGNQHKHDIEHLSVVMGRFLVWVGDQTGIKDTVQPIKLGWEGGDVSIVVEAHKFHRFLSVDPGGILTCIFKEKPEIEGRAEDL